MLLVMCNLLIINLSTSFIVHMFMCILNCELCVYSKSCSFRLDLELVTSHAISRQNSIQKIDKYLRKLKLMKEFHVIVLHYLIHLNHENEQCLVLKIVKRLNWNDESSWLNENQWNAHCATQPEARSTRVIRLINSTSAWTT